MGKHVFPGQLAGVGDRQHRAGTDQPCEGGKLRAVDGCGNDDLTIAGAGFAESYNDQGSVMCALTFELLQGAGKRGSGADAECQAVSRQAAIRPLGELHEVEHEGSLEFMFRGLRQSQRGQAQ